MTSRSAAAYQDSSSSAILYRPDELAWPVRIDLATGDPQYQQNLSLFPYPTTRPRRCGVGAVFAWTEMRVAITPAAATIGLQAITSRELPPREVHYDHQIAATIISIGSQQAPTAAFSR